ncbi:MAG: orotate phosphoribosyltransferase [Bacillota bacterium]
MKREEIEKMLKETGVIQEGHFVLTSGRHANIYMQCAKVLQYPEYAAKLAGEIAEKWKDTEIDVVIGPALGGVVLSYAAAEQIGVRSLFSERKNGSMQLRRGFDIKKGEKALIVEDVVTTGGSVKEVIELMEEKGADIVGISSIIDRSSGNADFNYQFKPLLKVDIKSYKANECELCQKGIPVTRPGSRA